MSETKKKLGKIQSCEFGFGGYQDAMIGVSFVLGGDHWSVGDFWGDWAQERSGQEKWSEQDRVNQLGAAVMRLNKLLRDAKKDRLSQLKGVPIEVEIEGGVLKSWRILAEVL